ncbi:MAG TPA: ABC transporter ATP-binding protein [Candidatus Acidoferrales bacterium]|nr:ABC transporter ATP-binding protein [Candidatus Acidoferrales bacterium]
MGQSQPGRFYRVVREHLVEVKGRLSIAAVCTLLLAFADLLRPWPLKLIFDYILFKKPIPHSLSFMHELIAHGTVTAVVLISSGIVAIALLKSFAAYSQTHIVSQIGFRFAHSLRRALFVHLQRLSLSFHTRMRSGELLTNITSDTNVLRDALIEFVLTFVSEFLTLLGMIVIMVTINWKLSLIVLAVTPVLVFLSLVRYRKIRDSARRQRRAEGQIAAKASEVFSSMHLVQAFGRGSYEKERFENDSVEALKESVRTARLEAAAARAADLTVAAGTWAVVLVGSVEALMGQMTPGNVLVFAAYMNSMYTPIRNLAKLSSRVSRAAVVAHRIAEVLDLEPDIQDAPDAIEAADLKGKIKFNDVSFAYQTGAPVLNHISFTVAPGQQVALLGRSGSGKSTLSALTLRLYDPQAGTICIDGVDVRKYRLESLRREIGIVLQDSLLFATTVRENIAYGRLDATEQEIVAAAKAANAHEFIMQLENGYDTVVGERGATLSGGQRQRIAIARTFIRDMPILILDEPMTGLDIESETTVREALRRLMSGRTSILITHDLEAASEADLILLLADGQIIEQGSHQELLLRNGQYRDLWEFRGRTGIVSEVRR